MTVADFFAHTNGARRFSFDENERSMCGSDFWHKYRGDPIWFAEIDSVKLIPQRDVGLSDIVICLIKLK